MTAAEDLARQRDGHNCQRCGRSIVDFPSSLHHRQPKGMGGGALERYDRVVNLIRLCGTATTPHCHRWAHNATERYDSGFLVHRWDDPGEVIMTRTNGSRFGLTDEGTVVEL